MPKKARTIPDLTPEDKARFWSKVDKRGPDDCWEWTASKFKQEYGQFYIKGRGYVAQRIAYLLEFGFIPEDLFCLHTCDNPPCCNPSHLFLGTHQDNMNDRSSKGRSSIRPGESHPMSKLKEFQVLDILHRCENGDLQKEVAKIYEVSPQHVSDIVNGKKWRHLHD